MKKLSLTIVACLCLPLIAAGCDEGEDFDAPEVAAEDGEQEDQAELEDPTGKTCDINMEPTAECLDGSTAYCSNMGESVEFGPCLAEDEIECTPGASKDLGPHGDEWMQDVCGNRWARCEVWGGIPSWEEQYCETPLVLSFDGAPVEFIAAEATPMATFDISMQHDSCIATDWPSAATPWLAMDRDGDGLISGGNELFGSGTRLASSERGAHARDGFAALADLDDNRDGFIDAKDAHFAQLLLWRDHDADRSSTPGELSLLSESGVTQLPVASKGGADCDERGNCAALGGRFETSSGVGQVLDVYLGCQ